MKLHFYCENSDPEAKSYSSYSIIAEFLKESRPLLKGVAEARKQQHMSLDWETLKSGNSDKNCSIDLISRQSFHFTPYKIDDILETTWDIYVEQSSLQPRKTLLWAFTIFSASEPILWFGDGFQAYLKWYQEVVS
ncbi:hypothetical protein P5673_012860 [Acropora cervicornis]|uniref:Uncharacterized protein n=1 Tax=Acropora cervicornis TaxID=6130 RepID=A0AAD9V781_ACRCE|nr:hypothetical protein P5673_012860 [Acropora cervicornis]